MPRVLLVDDDTTGLEIRKLLLEHAGHQVIAMSHPAEALAQCRESCPDTAILDVRLPDAYDGLALIRELHIARPGLRLIVLCGFAADLEGRPERAFIDKILTKPARPEHLLSAVNMKSS